MYVNCFLPSVVTDKKDESELKLGKVWSSFYAMPAENINVVIVP